MFFDQIITRMAYYTRTINEEKCIKKPRDFLGALKRVGGIWGSNPRPPEPQSGALTN